MTNDIDIRPIEEAFAEAYLATWSVKAAYKATHPDATDGTCYTEGAQWLKKPEVLAHLSSRLDEAKMSADEVIAQLTKHARQGSIRALTVLAKAHGLLIDRIDAKVEHQVSWKQFIEGDGTSE
jgi:phage terminase small subunit